MSEYLTVQGLRTFRSPGSTARLDFDNWTTTELGNVLDRVEALFEGATGHKFYRSTTTYLVNGSGHHFLFLPQSGVKHPILLLTSVEEIDFDGAVLSTYVQDEDYRVEGHYLYTDVNAKSSGRQSIGASTRIWPLGHHNIKIVGDFGWDPTPVLIERVGYQLAVVWTLGEGYAGLPDTQKDVKREEWEDYEIEFGVSKRSSTELYKGVPNITGYRGIDQVLANYLNHADLFLDVSRNS